MYVALNTTATTEGKKLIGIFDKYANHTFFSYDPTHFLILKMLFLGQL